MSETPTRHMPAVRDEKPERTYSPFPDMRVYPPQGDVPLVPTPPALDDQVKIAAAKSPTGTPRVKPKQINWLLAGTLGAVAGLELCAQQAPSPTVQLICRIGAVALGTFAGVASPGYRKR